MTNHVPRVLRPDSPAMTRYAPSTSSRPSASQRALLSRLAQHGELALEQCHAAVLAGLVRRGLVEIDDTHARLVKR